MAAGSAFRLGGIAVLVAAGGMIDFAAQVRVVALHAGHLADEAVAQLAVASMGTGSQAAEHFVAGQRISGRQAEPRRFRQGLGWLLRQTRPVEELLAMPHLPAEMEIKRNRQDFLLFLIADKSGLKPEQGLGKVQGPYLRQLEFEAGAQFQALAHPAR